MELEIRVGIITDGVPRFRETAEGIEIDNLLIGEGFHWQRRVGATFAGRIEMLDIPQGNIHAVNIVDIEDYISSVIGSEMNPDAPAEFLKAHAIISRSWAARKVLGAKSEGKGCRAGIIKQEGVFIGWEEAQEHRGFDVCNDDHCQRYQGIQRSEAADHAVRETRGLVLVDRNGEIADARFSKCCGGKTELFSTCWDEQDKEYLTSKEDPWCDLSDMEPEARERFLAAALKNYDKETADFHDWRFRPDLEQVRERLAERYGTDVGRIIRLEPMERGASGRICRLRIVGEKKEFEIGKTLPIRRLLATDCLKSSWFDVAEDMTLTGHGWGHGVGLCQIGAARMALEGKDYREILQFYYPGTTLEQLREQPRQQ